MNDFQRYILLELLNKSLEGENGVEELSGYLSESATLVWNKLSDEEKKRLNGRGTITSLNDLKKMSNISVIQLMGPN